MLNRRAVAICLLVSLLCLPVHAQRSDKDLLERFAKEENDHSQIMKTMHMLADVYGPRLTGSPNHRGAAEWAIKQMQQWGLANAHLEPWDFGHVGLAQRASDCAPDLARERPARLRSTLVDPEHARAGARQRLPVRSSRAADARSIDGILRKRKAKVRGRIVLAGKHNIVPVNLIHQRNV